MAPTSKQASAKIEAPQAAVILPKITIKDCGANPKEVFSSAYDNVGRHMLIRVYGVATSTGIRKLTNSNTGEISSYENIRGDFRAINLQSGQKFKSAVLYLPSGIHEMISEPLDSAKRNGERAEIQFGLDLFSKRADNVAGYGYGAFILGDPEEVDVIAQLEEKIAFASLPQDQRAALPAPEAA